MPGSPDRTVVQPPLVVVQRWSRTTAPVTAELALACAALWPAAVALSNERLSYTIPDGSISTRPPIGTLNCCVAVPSVRLYVTYRSAVSAQSMGPVQVPLWSSSVIANDLVAPLPRGSNSRCTFETVPEPPLIGTFRVIGMQFGSPPPGAKWFTELCGTMIQFSPVSGSLNT